MTAVFLVPEINESNMYSCIKYNGICEKTSNIGLLNTNNTELGFNKTHKWQIS